MTEKELMLSGQLYMANDKELYESRKRAKSLTMLFNSAAEEQEEYRLALLKELFKGIGKNIWIEPVFRCDYGWNIVIGDNFYANYDCTIIDVCDVIIGNNVFFAPRVSLFTASHPIDYAVRNTCLEYGKPITICDNVWVGGCTVVNPGVTIGEGTIIGSGSVVTKDIPPGVIAAGNPCRIIREITQSDSDRWNEQVQIYKQKRDC